MLLYIFLAEDFSCIFFYQHPSPDLQDKNHSKQQGLGAQHMAQDGKCLGEWLHMAKLVKALTNFFKKHSARRTYWQTAVISLENIGREGDYLSDKILSILSLISPNDMFLQLFCLREGNLLEFLFWWQNASDKKPHNSWCHTKELFLLDTRKNTNTHVSYEKLGYICQSGFACYVNL